MKKYLSTLLLAFAIIIAVNGTPVIGSNSNIYSLNCIIEENE